MSRGGTRKARAEQTAQRRARERKAEAAEKARGKASKEPRKKKGRGRAALIHLSGFLSPLLLALTLVFSGLLSEAEPGSGFWLDELIDDPNASYLAEPAGLVYALISVGLGVLLFLIAPLWLWRRLTRSVPLLERDLTAVDTTFTMSALLIGLWLVRIVVGFSDAISVVGSWLLVFSAYVPVFSALMALMMPIVPGSGRIGGLMPNFLRFPFTKRYLLSEDERREVEEAAERVRVEQESRRQEMRELRAARKAAKRAGS